MKREQYYKNKRTGEEKEIRLDAESIAGFILKREKGRISNDIEYYTHEMNKINDHKYTKEKTNEKDEENVFVKK